MSEKKTGLELLREPFPPNQISLLPKPTKGKEEMAKIPKGKCKECDGWHATSSVIHLSYVGHAALTDRLLDADPNWFWEPLALKDGLPFHDPNGGLWIRLTVCGMTRLGYGHAGEKRGGDAVKEVIGDALRNAAMRFGAALDLWHKGDLHTEDDDDPKHPTGHDKVDGEKTVGQVVDQNLAMERITDPAARKSIQEIAKAIEGDFYTLTTKNAVLRWQTERDSMNEAEVNALWECMNPTVRNNLKKCEDAMRVAA